MELSFAQIKELTVGALTFLEDARGLSFTRFTPTQVEGFPTEKQRDRTVQTTGIRVDFHTDANKVELTVGEPGKYEVLVDDLTAGFGVLEAGETLCTELSAGEHRVILVMPCHEQGIIQSIRLPGATFVKPHVYEKKAVFYGDSITQGWNSEKDSQSYAWLLTRYFDWESMNYGVGGSKFQPETVEDVGYDADVVITAMGTNNFNAKFSLAHIEEYSAAYFERIAQCNKNSKLFCITPIWRGAADEVRGEVTFAKLREITAAAAEKAGFTVIDGYDMVPHRAEYYAEEVNLHPNDMGFALYAQKLIKILTPYLQ